MNWRQIITVEPSKRSGKPCVRGMRLTVGDVLGFVATYGSWGEIIAEYPELTEDDIRACLEFSLHEAVEAGQADIDAGRVCTSEEVRQKFQLPPRA